MRNKQRLTEKAAKLEVGLSSADLVLFINDISCVLCKVAARLSVKR